MSALDLDGFALKRAALDAAALERLLVACEIRNHAVESRHPSGETYGVRGLLWSAPTLRRELTVTGVSALASEVLGGEACAVDAIFFDKQAEANWAVPGHQDRLMPIAAGSKLRTTVRNGVSYGEPPVDALEKLVALRVHFDDTEGASGALELVPGSHRRGVLDTATVRTVDLTDYQPCPASRGDVILMRPLVLHRSGRRSERGHRRVLHVVYADERAASGFEWRKPA